jgi:hypothetical protein
VTQINQIKDLSAAAVSPEPEVHAASQITPEFIRIPPSGAHCPRTGFKRSALYSLILPSAANDFKPPVKSFVLRKKGARTGIRLIDYASLVQFIRAHEAVDSSSLSTSEERKSH